MISKSQSYRESVYHHDEKKKIWSFCSFPQKNTVPITICTSKIGICTLSIHLGSQLLNYGTTADVAA